MPIKTTLNVYGHLIEQQEADKEERIGMIGRITQNSCG
jgi:hypothetical protein